jgi:DUF1680 family protein
MRTITIFLFLLPFVSCSDSLRVSTNSQGVKQLYLQNRAPLHPKKYIELPLGTIKPEGWLLQQLELMKDGMTGHLDEWYPSVVGERNGWLGGDGDGWERGAYWLDGLVPLAWLLDDQELKDKAMPWIEWALNSQTESGYFGPIPFKEAPEAEPGLQKTMRQDWWPKMVMLKVLQQYYEATGDERVITLMLRYFRFQLEELPTTPLDKWTFWANRRGGDNLLIVNWLYNITEEPFLLELGDLLHEQTFPWTEVFLNDDCYDGADTDHLYPYNTGNRYPFDQEQISRLCTKQLQSFHCVNLAQGIKEPLIRYQQDPNPIYFEAVEKAFKDIYEYHGQPQGMYGGDEPMHGKDPTQGIELCSVVELMFSLEKMIAISGSTTMMDHLEKIAYNALPAQANADFTSRQYFQQTNQVKLSRHRHNFYEEDYHGGTDLCYGLLTGYPCCTSNMHQGWPKLVTHMWSATDDGGLAVTVYGPSRITAKVADGKQVIIHEDTNYPFEDKIRFHISSDQPVAFPLHLRLPKWCDAPTLSVNGEKVEFDEIDGMAVVNRSWKEGDSVELHLPMKATLSRWVENSVAVERGPLVYALKLQENWVNVENDDKWGDYSEVHSPDAWNIGLLEAAIQDPKTGFEFVSNADGNGQNKKSERVYPWTLENAPVSLLTKGKIFPDWKLYKEMAGPLPHSLPLQHLQDEPPLDITLIPYGCTTLRVTEFPVVR